MINTKNLLITLLLFSVSIFSSYGQQIPYLWPNTTTFSSDFTVHEVINHPDGGYLLAGFGKAQDEYYGLQFIRFDKNGNITWRSLVRENEPTINHIMYDKQRKLFVAVGVASRYTEKGSLIIIIDKQGRVQGHTVQNYLGHNEIYEVVKLSNGDYAGVGKTDHELAITGGSNSLQGFKGFIMTFDTRAYSTNAFYTFQSEYKKFVSADIDSSGNVYVAVQKETQLANGAPFNYYSIIKYSPDLSTWIWERNYNSSRGYNYTGKLRLLNQNELILSGTSDLDLRVSKPSNPIDTRGNIDLLYINSSNGNIIKKDYLGTSQETEYVNDLHVNADGSYILSGRTRVPFSSRKRYKSRNFIYAMSKNKNLSSEKYFATSNSSYVRNQVAIMDNCNYITAYTNNTTKDPNNTTKIQIFQCLSYNPTYQPVKKKVVYSVYPNPFQKYFTVKKEDHGQKRQVVQYRVVDSNGDLLDEKETDEIKFDWDASFLNKINDKFFYLVIIDGKEKQSIRIIHEN